MQIASLNSFVKFLTESTGVRICLHDISGILADERLFAEHKYTIHSSEFCSAAKTTPRGLELCLKCKKTANRKAAYGGEYFCGRCAYGLVELAYPIVIDFGVKCIIYAGNVVNDKEETRQRTEHACRLTGVDSKRMTELLSDCPTGYGEEKPLELARLIESYMLLILKSGENDKRKSGVHWAVQNVKKYIDAEYGENITLRDCAELYFVNKKYLGRTFEKNVGMSFHKYLNYVRCENAKRMLRSGAKTITDIAFACGYSDVTYFNRVFKKTYGISPGEYRKNRDI